MPKNEVPLSMRESLYLGWTHWLSLEESLKNSHKLLVQQSKENEACKRLEKLQGVGTKNALGLYVAIGNGKHFKNGREASACIGLIPKQFSTGGKVNMKGIGKFKGNQKLRSSLIVGAMSMVIALEKREAKTDKERWLKAITERRGKGRAAVALVLANKTVRTAWAMLHNDEPYQQAC